MNADEIFGKVWTDFIARLQELRDRHPKVTLEKIGKMCGVSKVTVRRWIEGGGGEKTPFPDMLRYMQAVGMDISGIFASQGETVPPQDENANTTAAESTRVVSELRAEILELQKKIQELDEERLRYRDEVIAKSGEITALERQLEKYRVSSSQPDGDDKKSA